MKTAIDKLTTDISAETTRAAAAESEINDKLADMPVFVDMLETVPDVPRDADRLAGREPSYYATKASVDAETSRATAAESAINNSLNNLPKIKSGSFTFTPTLTLTNGLYQDVTDKNISIANLGNPSILVIVPSSAHRIWVGRVLAQSSTIIRLELFSHYNYANQEMTFKYLAIY